jgi:hypothetical protein
MHGKIGLATAACLLAWGCGEESRTAPDAVARTFTPEATDYAGSMDFAARDDRGESGVWDEAYADRQRYRIEVEAWFVSVRDGQPVSAVARLGAAQIGSLQVGFDPGSARVTAFGLRSLEVWIRILVFAVDA